MWFLIWGFDCIVLFQTSCWGTESWDVSLPLPSAEMHDLKLKQSISPEELPAGVLLELIEACSGTGDLCARYLVIRLLNRMLLGNLRVACSKKVTVNISRQKLNQKSLSSQWADGDWHYSIPPLHLDVTLLCTWNFQVHSRVTEIKECSSTRKLFRWLNCILNMSINWVGKAY